MPKLELTFDVETDDDGIVDGRELARLLIATAFQLVVPYVNGCHACADNLFTGIANDALAELHKIGHEQGQLDGYLYRPGLPHNEEAYDRHMEAAKETTRAMMGEGGEHNLH